ncbi:MAG: ATP-binding cassette domain-containing protein [Bacilli bacterium]|nr:ATP-binding cassette domain-containing protein [Bacilli bacterium]
MLTVKNITKTYGTLKAVDNLSFEVKEGEIFGLLGVNGAGKTTTFRMIVGLLEPDDGEITLNNHKIDYDITDTIGFLTEERSLFQKMTVKEQLLYYGQLKNVDKKTILERLDYWLKRFNIEEYKNSVIKELSKGNQQKIQFIAAVIHEPKLLILDEPFSALDPFNVSLMMEAIKEISKKGTMVIFSSHRMEHVEMFCEKLLILVKGKAILQGSLKQIKDDYQKKFIHIVGDIDIAKIKKLDGVEKIEKTPEEYIIKIASKEIIEKVFNAIKNEKNITRFLVEDPTLNEIFVSKVGEILE